MSFKIMKIFSKLIRNKIKDFLSHNEIEIIYGKRFIFDQITFHEIFAVFCDRHLPPLRVP